MILLLSILVAMVSCDKDDVTALTTEAEESTLPESADGTSELTVDEETTDNTAAEETTAAPALPDNMKFDEGYSIVSYNTFRIIVAENGEKLLHDARVAILKHIDGFDAIYVDVLDASGNVKLHKTWQGRGHLFLVGDVGLLLYRVHVDAEKKATLQLHYYEIADFKYTASGETPTGSTQFMIRNITHGGSVTASFASTSQIVMGKTNINVLLTNIDGVVSERRERGNTVYTIADSYSDKDKLVTYSPEDKVVPEVLDNVFYDKYKLEYILDLFGIDY